MDSLQENRTWTTIKRQPEDHIIQSKWVFKKKRDTDGNIKEYKARLVARGFQQIPGLEYNEVFSPVVRMKSMRTIFAIAAVRNWKVYHFDISGAYLNGILKERVIMEFPQTTLEDEMNQDLVCLLRKGLYGLKQGGKQWNEKLDGFLKKQKFIQSQSDPCVYFNDDRTVLLGIHVDDIGLTCEHDVQYKDFGKELSKEFKCKDLGEVSHILSMKIDRREDGSLSISQEHLIEELLQQYDMSEAKAASTPLPSGLKLQIVSPNKNNLPYRQLVGSLMYLANTSRPDIAFSASYLSQFNHCYDTSHWKAAKHVLRYLKNTKTLCLIYEAGSQTLVGHCDADWGSDATDRRSNGGYTFFIGQNLVSWSSRKQRTTALSSSEAEFVSMTEATKEAKWLKNLLVELGFTDKKSSVTIHADNQGAIFMANNKVTSERSKHIDIKHFFIREEIERGSVNLEYIPSKENIADTLTKITSIGNIKYFQASCNLKV